MDIYLSNMKPEKHFILDKSIGGPDAHFSLDEKEFKQMVDAIRLTEKMIGKVDYEMTKKIISKASLAKIKNISKNNTLKRISKFISNQGLSI